MICTYPDLDDWGGLIPGEVEEAAVERCEALAWSTMLGLTAGQVAICPITVWPNSAATGTATTTTAAATATQADGSLVTLPRPVGTVVSVSFSGVPFTLWRQEGAKLRRLDGSTWPTVTNMTLPVGQGEFEVTYYRGRKPGPSFIWAVGQLAAEFYLATADLKGKKCRLPSNVTAITRQGVTYEVNPGIFADGLTGIREIDAVVRLYNPNTLRQPTLVMSVDSIAQAPIRVS